MTSKWSNRAKFLAGATAGLNLEGAATGGDIGVLLVKTGWVFATYKDDVTLADLDLATYEYAGAGYSRKYLGNASWVADASGNQSKLVADPTVWAALSADTDPAIGVVLFREDGASDAQRIFLGFNDAGGFPKDGTGDAFTIDWDDVGGVMSLADDEA